MKNKQSVLERVQSEFKDSPETIEFITSLWDNFEDNVQANENSKDIELPEPYIEDEVSISGSQESNQRLPFSGLPSYYGYDNYVIQDHNTCGQAVIGSFVDYYGKNPFNLTRNVMGYDGKLHFDNLSFIGNIFHQYGPNYPFPNGVTVRETIITACTAYGLKCHEYYPGAGSNGLDSKNQLTSWIKKYRKPVAVLVDTTKPIFSSNPTPFSLHWCTVYAYDAQNVYIATWANSFRVPWGVFMESWHCWWLPYPNNYYQLRVWDK